jgi:anti-sigma factor RsiW
MTDARPAEAVGACDEMRLLIQADLDGELDAAATAVLTAHVASCPGCLAAQRELLRLSAALREAAPRHRAPDALRRRIEATLAPAAVRRFRRLRPLLSFAAGAALAAGIAVALLPTTGGQGLYAQLLASHIRALQPGHLTDVVSTDQHTVKPWFNGRIDFSPPVRDFAAQGFPLVGGRLDYVGGRAVAVLVYGHGRHMIDVYVWPARGREPSPPASRQGYNFASWSDHGMQFSAVSDVDPAALAGLVRLWSAAPGAADPRS